MWPGFPLVTIISVVPNLFGTRGWFHGRQLFHRLRGEEWFWDDSSILHLWYTLFLLLLHYICWNNYTIHHNAESVGALSLFSGSHMVLSGVMGDSDTWSVLLCPVYSVISLPSLQKTLLHKDRMLEMGAGFQCFCGHLRIYVKDVYCHPAYLTYMQSTSWDMLGWRKHKLESRLPWEISITSDMQMTPLLWQKVKN